MADITREPAPERTDFQELEEAEDLFPEPAAAREESGPASLPAEDISTNSNGPKQDSLFDDDPEDLFAEATEEVSLDSPERDVLLSDGPSPAITPITPPTSVITPCIGHDDMFTHSSFDEIEEEEVDDSFDMQISVSDPEKVGDGMNAYMAYKVTIKTSISLFKQDEFSVKRRFSDFLGLHSKLASKYLHIGYIVPPAPEKSIVGMTKVKVGKEDQSSNEFVEKRRSALERYLMRTVKHPVLLKDPDVLQFLESSDVNNSTTRFPLRTLFNLCCTFLCHAFLHQEIEELEGKVQQGERDFEQISKTIRKEVSRFEKERVKDFKTIIIKYLESLVQTQQQLIKYWEAFLPEAKAIS
nr:PREDICTED: sorting nexin-2-like [Paralichthys olivaceus]